MAAATGAGPLELECSVCCELLIDPRTLNCAHTFCMKCLMKLFHTFSSLDNTLACPLCRQDTVVEGGDLYSLPSNTEVDAAVESFKGQVDSIRSRTETKVQLLIDHVSLINDAEEVVNSSHTQAMAAIEEAFDEALMKLSERSHGLTQICTQYKQEQMFLLSEMRETNVDLIRNLGTASESISDDAQMLVEDEVLAVHQSATTALEDLLGREEPDDSQPIAIAQTAADFKFFRHRGHKEIDLGILRDPKSLPKGSLSLLCEFPLSKDTVMGMVLTPDNRIAVGYRDGGIEIFTEEGLQETVLQDVHVWALAILSDGHLVVRDRDNAISLHTPEYGEVDVTFNTIEWLKAGHGDLAVDGKDNIYVSYWLYKKIQVFSREGGKPLREITCRGCVPHEIRVAKRSNVIIVKDGPTVQTIDDSGAIKHQIKKGGVLAYPAFLNEDGDVLIAWVDDSAGLVSFEMSPATLNHSVPLLSDYRIGPGWPGRCYLLVTSRMQVVLYRRPKIHIFSFPPGTPCCIL